MATQPPQNFSNHKRNPPPLFALAGIIFLVYVGWMMSHVIKDGFSFGGMLAVFLGIGFLLISFYARHNAQIVQDRVIRLEMRLRLAEILPSDLRQRIPEFTLNQLLALRFAGDAELPELARKVLDEKIDDRTSIKKLIKDWQPDYLRV